MGRLEIVIDIDAPQEEWDAFYERVRERVESDPEPELEPELGATSESYLHAVMAALGFATD